MRTNDVPVLQGGYAPVYEENVFDDLKVIGEIPSDLNGMYVRNGPNPRFVEEGRYHWFDGDGMLHSVLFEGGKVQYRNRWVMTDSLKEELGAGRSLWRGIKEPPRRDRPDMPIKNTSNTDVKFHNGKLVTMWYLGGDLYESDPYSLETTGKKPIDSRIAPLPVSAHSRVDERTNEFLFFAYGKEAPYMHYGVIGADGSLKHLIPVALPGPRLPHDMAITEHYTILHDFPLFHDQDALAAGRHKLKFHSELPSRFAVAPRYGSVDQIRWFEAKPTYMYHVSNAWEEVNARGETEIVMTGTPFRLSRDRDGNIEADKVTRQATNLEHDFIFYEWRFNLATGQTYERVIDDIVNTEFPIVNSWMQGYKTRYSWNVLMGRNRVPEQPRFCGLTRFDLQTGTVQAYNGGVDFWYSEAPFAPRDNWKHEDDGYLVGFVWNGTEQRSEVHVFDASNVGQGPVCRILLPKRVPHGFHATWVSKPRLLAELG
ncbi:carotenoid oxygenase family protein [Paraburkholderia sp. J76]|uniref:carotenoid oxygenase family protein n=1 Tax=Paraburkholderia sp. J76 TaxID=2805439 RepID=UPI002ABDDD56|nr:carotenoid oxygenase family protein [Paraburkholderia sp. J76]